MYQEIGDSSAPKLRGWQSANPSILMTS